jgi:hypothetical protein
MKIYRKVFGRNGVVKKRSLAQSLRWLNGSQPLATNESENEEANRVTSYYVKKLPNALKNRPMT